MAAATLGGCSTLGLYGVYGDPYDPYYDNGYYDPYYDDYYYGWYDSYYYPGTGYYVYDSWGKRHRWS
ncbi:MAG: hypothetical protein ABGW84_00765, partial [Sphingomonadaceae bacterium]